MSTASHVPAHRRVLADLLPEVALRNVLLVAGGILLLAASAQVSVPLPFSPVPVSGQTFAVLLLAASVGPLRAVTASGLYWVLGGLGLPFYAGAESGWQTGLGATGGYLVGFVLASLVVGELARRGGDRTPARMLATYALGSLVIYAVGLPWLAAVTGAGLAATLGMGLWPFLAGDAAKAVLAAALLPAAWRMLGTRAPR